MKKAIVTTTINIPYNLEAYAKDIRENGPEDTEIIVAGDNNTDPVCEAWCNNRGFYYMSPAIQSYWLKTNGYKEYDNFLPFECIQRRNVAILYAYKNGANVIATIDDDNLWEGKRYFEQHGINGKEEELEVNNGEWINICSYVECKDGGNFYPRGFGFETRREKKGDSVISKETGRIVVNGGLWIGDPDIDAVTRIGLAPEVISYPEGRVILGKNAKCPFNSQNTALHRDVIPAYCLATGLGRYDDIVASYIVKRIADHLGDYISFGKPIVRQVRNKHDLFKDLEDELVGMQVIDRLVDWLYETKLTGKTYKDCAVEAISGLRAHENDGDLNAEQMAFVRSIVRNYDIWLGMF